MPAKPAAPAPTEIKADTLAEHLGFRRVHVLVLMTAVLNTAMMAPMQGVMNLLLDSIQTEFGVSDHLVSLAATLTPGSSSLGGFLFGRLYDVVGRRKGLIITASLAMILSMAHFLVPYGTERGFYSLLALRFCYGLPYGGFNVLAFTYPTELFPNDSRGMVVALGSMGWNLCFFYMLPFVPAYETTAPWRSILAFLPWGPGLLTLLVCAFIPESPRWLLSEGRCARESLQAIFASRPLYGSAVVGDAPRVDVSDMTRSPSYGLGSARTIDAIKMMFSPKLVCTTILSSLLYAIMTGTCASVTMWGPFIVKEAAGHEPGYNIFLYAEGTSTLACIFIALVIDRVSRRFFISTSFMLMACAFCMFLHDPGTRGSALPFAAWLAFKLLENAVWPVVCIYVAEAFPTTLRGIGIGFAFTWGRLAACVCPTLAGMFVRRSYKYLVTVAIIACICEFSLAMLIPRDTSSAPIDDVVEEDEPTVGHPGLLEVGHSSTSKRDDGSVG